PTFTWLSALASAAAGDSVVGTAVAYRVLAVAFGWLAAWALWRLARDRGDDGLVPLALYARNPLALVETASSGHNEAVMIALALAGLLFMQRRRPVPGVLLLVASTTVKYVTGAVLGLALAAAVFEARGARARVARAAGLGGLALVAGVLLFAP